MSELSGVDLKTPRIPLGVHQDRVAQCLDLLLFTRYSYEIGRKALAPELAPAIDRAIRNLVDEATIGAGNERSA